MTTYPQTGDLANAMSRADGTTALHSNDHGHIIDLHANVKHYGATGNGTADDTVAIDAAIAANPGQMIFFPKGTYKITSGLTFNGNGVLGGGTYPYMHADAELVYYGTGTAVTFYDWQNAYFRGPIRISVQRSAEEWYAPGTDSTSVGVKFQNCIHMRIEHVSAQKFYTGVEFAADGNVSGGGTSYMHTQLGEIRYNKRGLVGSLTNGGYITACYFQGGVIRLDGEAGPLYPGTRYLMGEFGLCAFNQVMMEGNYVEKHVSISQGANVFTNCYWENASAGQIEITGATSYGNTFIGCYTNGTDMSDVVSDASKSYQDFGVLGTKITGRIDKPALTLNHQVGSPYASLQTRNAADDKKGVEIFEEKIYSYDASSQTYPVVAIMPNYGTASGPGGLRFGKGTADPVTFLGRHDSVEGLVLVGGSMFAPKFQVGGGATTDAQWSAGAGSPEGVVTATIGSLYSRTNGASGTTLYYKTVGGGNTGWVAVAGSGTSAYTVTNPTTDRALNVTGDTLPQVAEVLGTLIADLQTLGVIT